MPKTPDSELLMRRTSDKPSNQKVQTASPFSQGLLRLERQLFGSWLRFITSGWGDAGNGQRFEETMADVDGALRRFGGPYFLGKEVSATPCFMIVSA